FFSRSSRCHTGLSRDWSSAVCTSHLDAAELRRVSVREHRDVDVDVGVLSDADTSHLGRFAVTGDLSEIGAFKTPTLRNIAVTAPYMHDGSIATLCEVVEHYNNGGVLPAGAPVNPFLSGGIRPLDLTEQQIDDLVAFMESLTSPEFQQLAQPERVSALGAGR